MPRIGQNPKEYAARSVAALVEANSRLDRARQFYADVTRAYGTAENDRTKPD